MAKSNSIRISFPNTIYAKTLKFAEHIDCVSQTENPQASNAIRKVLRTILNYYGDEQIQECLENEGIDTLSFIHSFIQKCVRKGMKESLSENK